MLREPAAGVILAFAAAAPPDLAAECALVGAARPVEVGLLTELLAAVAADLLVEELRVALLQLVNALPQTDYFRNGYFKFGFALIIFLIKLVKLFVHSFLEGLKS
jgi:hypothetical protein